MRIIHPHIQVVMRTRMRSLANMFPKQTCFHMKRGGVIMMSFIVASRGHFS